MFSLFGATRTRSPAHAGCQHLAALDKMSFRRLLRQRFCYRDGKAGGTSAEASTAAGIARAAASVHFKSSGFSTMIRLLLSA